eukprot:COSAG02_NODE_1820_length_10770_cov_89.157905_4_plen_1024_part_00
MSRVNLALLLLAAIGCAGQLVGYAIHVVPATPLAATSTTMDWVVGAPYDFTHSRYVAAISNAFVEGKSLPHDTPAAFNAVSRRSPLALFSGDLPWFALGTSPLSADMNPPWFKLGDLRFVVSAPGLNRTWLDAAIGARMTTTYHSLGTTHSCQPWPAASELWVNLTADLAETGTGISLTCKSSPSVNVEAWFGGMAVCPTNGYTFPDFFPSNVAQEVGNALSVGGQSVLLSANLTFETSGVTRTVVNTSHWRLFDTPASGPVVTQDAAMGVHLRATATWSRMMRMCFGGAGRCTYTASEPQVDGFAISTPMPLIDSAFAAAISGLESTYEPGKAWFEGLQGWKSYWCNNYQVDAAVHLGGKWLQRARDAIMFFAHRPGGLGSIYTASGSNADTRPAGLPYFLLSLYRYWRATGDDDLVTDVMTRCGGCRVLDELLLGLDPDGDQMLGFWSGGNEFLYQSDHLNLPGAALSPTIFMAGVLDRLAQMLPNHTLASRYKQQARYMAAEVIKLLWLPDKQRFASLRDFQNFTQTERVLYYTDLAFPSLYARSLLPANMTYHTLLSVESSNLWMPADESCPHPRLRVGNMLPILFGNSVPSVVAMAEMSEALLQGQLIDKGISLLEGVSATATARSNAPGNVMEYVSLDGRGSGDSQFGNPAGSLVLAIIRGLFGLNPGSGQNATMALRWSPAVPSSWTAASLRLPSGISIQISGNASNRTYSLNVPASRRVLILRVPLYEGQVSSVFDTITGLPLAHRVDTQPGGTSAEVVTTVARSIHVTVLLRHATDLQKPENSSAGAAVKAPSDTTHAYNSAIASGAHVVLTGERKPVDIFRLLNTNWTRLMNFWNAGHFAGFIFDGDQVVGPNSVALRNFSMRQARGQFENIPLTTPWFLVSANETRNSICLTLGDYGEAELATRGMHTVSIVLNQPDPRCRQSVSFAVDQDLSALEFLWAAEPRPRLTGETIGAISLETEGAGKDFVATRLEMPLVVGQNVDSMVQPYASDLTTRRVNVTWVNGGARQPVAH